MEASTWILISSVVLLIIALKIKEHKEKNNKENEPVISDGFKELFKLLFLIFLGIGSLFLIMNFAERS